MPLTLSCFETGPSLITPEALKLGSSQWSIKGALTSRATSKARLNKPAVFTGRPSSEKATAPAAASARKSVSDSPWLPIETAAMGSTRAKPIRCALSIMARTSSGRSITGLVLGMGQTAVKPPATAAANPVSSVSEISPPGSRK